MTGPAISASVGTMSKIREALADYAHRAWSGWMTYLFSVSVFTHRAGSDLTIHIDDDEDKVKLALVGPQQYPEGRLGVVPACPDPPYGGSK